MKTETLVIELHDMPTVHQGEAVVPEMVSEITPMSMDCFRLVGGGSSIIVLE